MARLTPPPWGITRWRCSVRSRPSFIPPLRRRRHRHQTIPNPGRWCASTGISSARRAGSSSACSRAGLAVALLDAMIPVFIGRLVTLVSTHAPATLLHDAWPQLLCMAAVLLLLRPAGAAAAEPDHQPGDRAGHDQPDPLAEPLACGAAELDVLPERLRRPHRQPGDADRARRCAKASSSATNAVWYILVYGSSALVLLSRTDLAAGAADAVLVRAAMPRCCACSCRACATARAGWRRCARR